MDYESLTASQRSDLVESVYTPFSEALRTLKERQHDLELQTKVSDFFALHGIPEPLVGELRAIISRCIATPNFEMKYFLEMSKMVGLDPLILEYPGKFVNMNSEKYLLGKMYFVTKRDGHRFISEKKNIIDFNATEGKMFKDIQTYTGESVVDLHHRLFKSVFPDSYSHIHDFAEWFDITKNSNNEYYFAFFTLFVVHGILFENYFSQDPDEYEFFCTKVLPSFKKVEEYFGVRPLIIPLLPLRSELANEWLWYNSDVKNLL